MKSVANQEKSADDRDEANQKGEVNNTGELKLANDFVYSKSIVLPLVKVSICLSELKNIKHEQHLCIQQVKYNWFHRGAQCRQLIKTHNVPGKQAHRQTDNSLRIDN